MNLLIFGDPSSNKDYTPIFNAIEKLEYHLIGFLSDDAEKSFQSVNGYMFYPMAFVYILDYDFLLIDCPSENLPSIIEQAPNLEVPKEKIKSIYWLLQQLMIKKYEDLKEPVIQETLKYWKKNELTVFNQHMANYETTFHEVAIDEANNMPYIMFETVEGKKRKMYYPPDYGNIIERNDGKKYIAGILREQIPTSPHLYIKGDHKVKDGDILIDAGVCEGNFALRYVDICSKIYLFEMDPYWFAPLYLTFKDYWDKVTLVSKAVADTTKGGTIAIDDAVNIPKSSSVFLKMDIEGWEPAGLRGARRILSNNKVTASICSYHNAEDIVKIKSILQKYGYKTWTSNGYMVFTYDPNIWETADFRKGIVYAENY
ncbi:MAG: hypothetical protein IJT73_07910 [Selenomonadaceae bacterium]|nr:hypothetical protein [Selenomonadaceae bacterium]